MFKNCSPSIDYINEINTAQVHNSRDIYVVILMYNLIKSRDNYSKISRS